MAQDHFPPGGEQVGRAFESEGFYEGPSQGLHVCKG